MKKNQPLISNELFRYFFRLHYRDTQAKNEELDEINLMFSEYLRNKCSQEQLDRFVPKSEMHIIMEQVKKSPFKINGFDPAFILHFSIFVEEERKKT